MPPCNTFAKEGRPWCQVGGPGQGAAARALSEPVRRRCGGCLAVAVLTAKPTAIPEAATNQSTDGLSLVSSPDRIARQRRNLLEPLLDRPQRKRDTIGRDPTAFNQMRLRGRYSDLLRNWSRVALNS